MEKLILVLSLVLISGSPMLNSDIFIKVSLPVYFVFLTIRYWSFLRKKYFDLASYFFLVFGFLFFIQAISYEQFQFAYISFLLKIFCGGLVIYICGKDFIGLYIKSIVLLSIISIPFYFLQLVIGPDSFPSLVKTFSEEYELKSILIHTVVPSDEFRNSGFAWEPGALQGFINLALFFSLVDRKKYYPGGWGVFWMVLALVSTFSTTGYVVLAMISIYYVFIFNSKIFRLALLPIVAFVLVVLYTQISFIGEKIESQLDDSVNTEEFFGARFSSFNFDKIYFLSSPIIGNGFVEETRWRFHPDFHGRNLGHGNGFTDFLVSVGLIGFFCYFYKTFKSFGMVGSPWFLILMLVVMLQGEHFLNLVLFLGLPFVRVDDE